MLEMPRDNNILHADRLQIYKDPERSLILRRIVVRDEDGRIEIRTQLERKDPVLDKPHIDKRIVCIPDGSDREKTLADGWQTLRASVGTIQEEVREYLAYKTTGPVSDSMYCDALSYVLFSCLAELGSGSDIAGVSHAALCDVVQNNTLYAGSRLSLDTLEAQFCAAREQLQRAADVARDVFDASVAHTSEDEEETPSYVTSGYEDARHREPRENFEEFSARVKEAFSRIDNLWWQMKRATERRIPIPAMHYQEMLKGIVTTVSEARQAYEEFQAAMERHDHARLLSDVNDHVIDKKDTLFPIIDNMLKLIKDTKNLESAMNDGRRRQRMP